MFEFTSCEKRFVIVVSPSRACFHLVLSTISFCLIAPAQRLIHSFGSRSHLSSLSPVMSRDWSGKRPQKSWNWTDDNWDTSTDSWTVKDVQPPAVRIPPEWKTTQTMFDEETLYGHKCYKTIQPILLGVGERDLLVLILLPSPLVYSLVMELASMG